MNFNHILRLWFRDSALLNYTVWSKAKTYAETLLRIETIQKLYFRL